MANIASALIRKGIVTHTPSMPNATLLVWDKGVRLFHWGSVAAITAAAITGVWLGAPALAWHLAAGSAVAAALIWRLVWGFLGNTHARFADFLPTPASLRDHFRNHARPLGHNPLGSLMVFALIAVLAAIIATGTATLGGRLKQGPLHALSYATGSACLFLHKALAIALLVMIGLHVAGVAYESRRERQNLVASMITGRKSARQGAIPPSPGRPLTAMGLTASVLAGLAAIGYALTASPRHDWPPPPPPVVALQCGACHLAFPPNLAQAATWNEIFADLAHHFGADATLSPDQIVAIQAYYDANAAAHWDTLPAHMALAPSHAVSRRITDGPGWRHLHRDIPGARFTTPPVYRRSNCAACHLDASTGQFAPQEIGSNF